jgi:hypothetical protein
MGHRHRDRKLSGVFVRFRAPGCSDLLQATNYIASNWGNWCGCCNGKDNLKDVQRNYDAYQSYCTGAKRGARRLFGKVRARHKAAACTCTPCGAVSDVCIYLDVVTQNAWEPYYAQLMCPNSLQDQAVVLVDVVAGAKQ